MANPYIELYKKKQKEDQGSQQTTQQTTQTQKQTQSTTGNPYIDLYNQRQQQPKPSQQQPTVYEQRKARQEKASEAAKKAWWEVLGLAAQDASAAATGQQRTLTAEEVRQRVDAASRLSAARKENKEANKVIEWDGRKELLKEYRRLDEIDTPKARQEAAAIREQLRQGDIKAGNLDTDGDMAYNVGDWSSNVVPGAVKNVGSAVYNAALTAVDLYAKGEAMKGPTEQEIITEYLTGQDIGSTAKMRQESYNSDSYHNFMNERYAEADKLAASAQRNLQIAKENQAPIVKAGTDVAENMLEMGFDGGVAMLTGGSALIPMAARVFGSSAMEARQAGASLEQQALYGLSSAALEVATEKLGDGLGGLYGKGFTQNATEHMIQRLASTDPGRTFLRFISGLNSEGMEEVISGIFEPALKSIYNGKTPWQNYSEFEWGDLLYDYALGAAAAIFGGASNIVNGGDAYANAQLRAAEAAQAKTDSNFGWMLPDSVKEQARDEQFDRMFISGTPNAPTRNAAPAEKPEMKEAKTPAQRRVEAIINAASTQDQLVQSLQFFQSKPELDAAFEELTGSDIDAYLAEASQEAAGGVVPQGDIPAPATPENAQQQAPGEFNSVNEAGESSERGNAEKIWPNMNYDRIAEWQNRNMRDASGTAVDFITGDLYNHNNRPYRQFEGELHPKQLEWSADATQQQYGYAEPKNSDNGRRQTDQYNSTIQTAIEQVREDGTNANRIMEGVGEWRDVDPQVRADIMNHIDPRGDYYVSEDKASGAKVVVKANSRLESETNERNENAYEQEMRDAGVKDVSPQEIRNGALANSGARLETRYEDSYIPSERRSAAASSVYTSEELAAIDKYNRRRDAQKHRENFENWLTEHNIDPGKEPIRNARLGEPRIEIRSAWMQRTMRDKALLGDLVNGTGSFKQFSGANRLDALRTMYPDANWQFDANTNTITLPGDPAFGKSRPSFDWRKDNTPAKKTAVGKTAQNGGVSVEGLSKKVEKESSGRSTGTGRRVSNEQFLGRVARGMVRDGGAGAARANQDAGAERGGPETNRRGNEERDDSAAPILKSQQEYDELKRDLDNIKKRGWHPIGRLTQSMADTNKLANALGVPLVHADGSESSSESGGFSSGMIAVLRWGKGALNKAPTAVHEMLHVKTTQKFGSHQVGNRFLLSAISNSPIASKMKAVGKVYRESYEDNYSKREYGKEYAKLSDAQKRDIDSLIGAEIFNDVISNDPSSFKESGAFDEATFAKEFGDFRKACVKAALQGQLLTREEMNAINDYLKKKCEDDYRFELTKENLEREEKRESYEAKNGKPKDTLGTMKTSEFERRLKAGEFNSAETLRKAEAEKKGIAEKVEKYGKVPEDLSESDIERMLEELDMDEEEFAYKHEAAYYEGGGRESFQERRAQLESWLDQLETAQYREYRRQNRENAERFGAKPDANIDAEADDFADADVNDSGGEPVFDPKLNRVPEGLTIGDIQDMLNELDMQSEYDAYKNEFAYENGGREEYQERRRQLEAWMQQLEDEEAEAQYQDLLRQDREAAEAYAERARNANTLEDVNSLLEELEQELHRMDMDDEVRADKWSGDEDFRPNFYSDSEYYKRLNEEYRKLDKKRKKLEAQQRGDYRLGPKAAAKLDAEAHANATTIDPYDDGGIDVDADDFELPYRADNKEMQRREDLNRQSEAEQRQQPKAKGETPESSKQYLRQNRLRKSDFENRETERGGVEAQFKAEEAQVREEIEHDEAYDRAQEEGKLLAEMKQAYGEKTQKSLADLANKVKGLVGSSRLNTSGQRGYVNKDGELVGHVKGDVTESFSYNEGGRDIESFAHVLDEFAAGRQTFSQLAEAYDKLGSYSEKKKGSYFYDKVFAEQFERLRDALDNGDVRAKDGALDPKFVRSVEDLTKRVVHRFEYMQNMLKFRSHLAEVYGEGKPFRTKAGALAKALEAAHRFQLRPSTAFKMLSGYDKANGSAWYELADMARDATKNYINTFQNAQDYLRELTERKDWEDFSTGKTTVKNVIPNLKYDGDRLSANAAVSFLKMLETDGAYDHIIRNGIVEMARTEKALYGGQNNNGFGEVTGYSQTFDPISEETRAMLDKAKTREEREAARAKATAELNAIKAALHAEVEACPAAKAFYDASFAPLNFLKKALNKTSRKVWGTDAAVQDKFYWPLEAGGKREGNELLNDHSFGLDQYRNVQARTGDRGGLKVRPATDVMHGYIRSASHWAAYQELSDMLEILSKDFRDTSSITQLLNDNAGKAWSKWLENYEADLNENRGKDKGYAGKIIGSLRSNLAQSSLLLNAGVALKQAPSGLDFMTVLDADIVAKRFLTGFFRPARSYRNNPLIQTMEAYTKMLKNRQAGYNTVETGEATETGRKGFVNKLVSKLPGWMTNWITKTDFRTVANGLLACEDQVKRNIKNGVDGYANLKEGTDAYYQAIADLFENAVMDTQPIYNKEYRADALRTDNEVLRILNMFRTQQTQNYNNLVETIGEYNAAKLSGDEEATKAARNRMGRTIAGQVSSAFVFAMLDAAAKMLMHKKKQYEDEDGNLSASIISQKVGWNFANSLASTSWLVSKISPFVINQMTKLANKATKGKVAKSDFYSGSLDGTLALVDDFASALDSFTTKPSLKTGKALVLNLASLTGMPLKNAYNIVNTIAMYGIDAAGLNVKSEDDLVNYLDGYYNATDSSKGKQAMLRAISLNKKGKSESVDAIMASLEPDALKSAKQQLNDSFIAGDIDAKTYRDWLRKYFGANSQEVLKLLHSAEDAKIFSEVENSVKANVGEKAYEQFTKSMSKLNGTTDQTGKERLDLISGLGLTEKETDIYVQKFMPTEYFGNYEALRSIGVKPNRAQAFLANIDADSGGTITQEEVYSWLLDNSQDKRVANALWEAKGWSTSLDKYAESYAKDPVNILVSFGMDKKEATRVSKQLNYDGKNGVTQEDFFNYLKKHPDQEEALKAVFAVKWPKSDYESKKRKYR